MKKLLLLLFLWSWVSFIFAQSEYMHPKSNLVIPNAMKGYYITTDKTVSDIYILETSPQQRTYEIIIPKQQNHEYKILYPADIVGYGFENDGSRYCSATVYIDGKEQNVFLEELIKGEDGVTFYVYEAGNKQFYFVQRGKQPAQLIEDPEIVRNYLRNKAKDCSKLKIIDSYPIKMERNSLLKMSEAYTHCNTNVFLRFRYGVTAGVSLNFLKIGNNSDYKYKKEVDFFPGIFIEIPLDIRFSFRPEFLYTSTTFTGRPDKAKDKLTEMKFKRESLLFPLMFRYTLTGFSGKYLPYFELGPIVDIRLSGEKALTTATRKHKVSRYQYGGALGGGMEFKLNPVVSLYAGLRYSLSKGTSADENQEVHNRLALNFSIGF